MQYSNGTGLDGVTGDPFDVTIPPTEQFLNSYTVSTEPSGTDPNITQNYLNIVAPTSEIADIFLDGSPLPSTDFAAIPGSSYSGAQVAVGFGSHAVNASSPFGLTVYGYGVEDGYGYPGGFALAPIAAPPPEGGCTLPLPSPTKLSVEPGEMSATVSWAPIPSYLQGCIQGYVVTPSGSGSPIESMGPGTTTVIYGLTDGASVTFTVAAANSGGIWAASPPTAPIVIGAPAAPSMVRATKIAGRALRVSFTPPAGDGAPIDGYAATCRSSNGGKTRTAWGRTRQLTVVGLTAGKTYSCTVVAANRRGASRASSPSARVKV